MFRSQAFRLPGRERLGRWLTALLLACSVLPVLAQTARPTDALGRYILAGRWEEAEAELASLRGRLDVDPVEILFLTGMMAQGQKQYDRAVESYRRILDAQPSIVRVRLELARALYEKGDDQAAKYHFELAMAGGLPPTVQANVQRYLDQIRRRRDWTLDAGFGLLPDSNINTGSNQQYVSIGGLPFTLSTEAREKSGIGAQLSVQGTKSVRLADRWQLRAFGSALRRDYPDSVFDDMIVRGGIGPRRLFERGEFGIAPFYSERRFGNDILNRADGLRADGQWQFAPRFIAEGALEYQRVTYPSFPDRNGGVTWSFLGMRYLASAETQLLLGVDYYRDDARDPTFRNESTGWTLGHFRDWAWALSTGVTVRVADTQYQGIQPLFGEYRNDRFTTITANLTKRDWSFYDFVPTVSITFFDNDSSIPFYSFQRRQVLFAVNRRL
jgi:tetratricopeptide (TPR) repeat protein